jgi:hypothetical protein
METAVEIIEKRGWFAFVNNGFAIVGLGGQLHLLAEEIKILQKYPAQIDAILDEEAKKYENIKDEIILKTIQKIYAAIIYNVSVGLSIAEDWKQHNENKS